MNCKQVNLRVVFLFFDNELAETQRLSFKDHVERCPECAKQVDYARRLLVIFRQRCGRQVAPPRLRARILTSLPHRREL